MQLNDVFENLTEKQHEVLGLVGDNFTSKQIAYELGISVSAVNQRIECVRSRAGALSRLELARAYRMYRRGRDAAEGGDLQRPELAAQDEAWPDEGGDDLAGVANRVGVDEAACRDCERWPNRARYAGAGAPRLQLVKVQPPSAEAERVAADACEAFELGGSPRVRAWRRASPGTVPALLDGRDGRLGRVAAIVVIAFGLLLVSVAGLGVLHTLAHLF